MSNTPEIGLTNEMEKMSEIKETPQQQQEQKEEEKNIEEYIESLCKCAIDIARSVVRLFEFYKQVPPEVMKTEPMRRIQEKVLKLLCINLQENNKQSRGTSKQQDSDDDPMLSNPEVKDCLEELDEAFKAKRRWLITKVAMQRSGRGVPQESGEIRPPALSEMNPLVIECIREIDKAIEAKRRFVIEMTS